MLQKANTNPSTELSTFTFELEPDDRHDLPPSFDIRTVTFEDAPNDPWFVAADVCKALGITNPSNALKVLGVDERSTIDRMKVGMRPGKPALIISESGLYKLVMRSDKPQAKLFQDWVTRDVLPAIRKDGMYVMGEEKVKTGEMTTAELSDQIERLQNEKIKRLEAEAALQQQQIAAFESQTETLIQQKGELAEDNAALEAVKAQMEPMVEKYRQFLCVDGTFNKEAAAGILGFRSAIMFNR